MIIKRVLAAIAGLFIGGIVIAHAQTQKGKSTLPVPFPAITGISPSSGTVGTVVTLTGTGFTRKPGSTVFLFSGVEVAGRCANTTTCKATVPLINGVVQGTVGVYVVVGGRKSQGAVNLAYFAKTQPCKKGTGCS